MNHLFIAYSVVGISSLKYVCMCKTESGKCKANKISLHFTHSEFTFGQLSTLRDLAMVAEQPPTSWRWLLSSSKLAGDGCWAAAD